MARDPKSKQDRERRIKRWHSSLLVVFLVSLAGWLGWAWTTGVSAYSQKQSKQNSAQAKANQAKNYSQETQVVMRLFPADGSQPRLVKMPASVFAPLAGISTGQVQKLPQVSQAELDNSAVSNALAQSTAPVQQAQQPASRSNYVRSRHSG